MADTDEEFFNLKTPLWEEWVARFLADTEKVKASVVKEDLNIPNTEGKYAFCLYNALTLEECNWLIKQTEALGYTAMPEYPAFYRSNTRVMVTHEELANGIWNRVKHFVPETLTPYIEGQHWDVMGINERFRFCRYLPGQHFNPHFDGQFRRESDEHSFLTFMIYLNDVTEGGATNFIQERAATTDPRHILRAVPPKAGSILVFTHKIYHDGARLDGGKKYLMRSDVMYKRRPVDKPNEQDSDKQRAKSLAQKAQKLEKEGKAEEAASAWSQAFKLCPELENDLDGDTV